MEFRRLGGTGLHVSEISYGNWLTHGELIDRDTALGCVRAALDHGITTFDTADAYARGAAEEVLGEALRGVSRQQVEIFTKVCLPVGDGANDRGLSRKHIMESANASLRRLRTDYIDLYQAHRYDGTTPLEETLIAFDDLVRQGKVLYLGVSEWRADQIDDALRIADQLGLRSRIVANQPQYSMLWRVIEPEVVPRCERAGIGQVIWQPLAQGVLTGKYRPGEAPPPGSRATAGGRAPRFISRVLSDGLLARVQRLRPLADEVGLSMAQLAIAWTLQHMFVATAIIGASRPEQVAENVGAAGVRLAPDLMARIDDVLGDLVDRDPAKTADPMNVMPAWRRADG